MATVVQTSAIVHVNGVDSTTVTLNSVVAGNALCLLLATYTGASPSLSDSGSATFSGGFTTQNTTDTNGNLFGRRAENVASGTHTVTINPTGASASITATLSEIGSTLTSGTADGTDAGTNGSSAAPASPSITIAAGSLLMGAMTHVDAGTITLTPTYTQLAEDESTADMPANMQSRGDGATLGAGTYTLAWTTGTSCHWTAGVMAFKDSGGGGGGFTAKARRMLAPVSRVGERRPMGWGMATA